MLLARTQRRRVHNRKYVYVNAYQNGHVCVRACVQARSCTAPTLSYVLSPRDDAHVCSFLS